MLERGPWTALGTKGEYRFLLWFRSSEDYAAEVQGSVRDASAGFPWMSIYRTSSAIPAAPFRLIVIGSESF